MLFDPKTVAPPPRYFRSRSALAYSAPLVANGISMPFYPVLLQGLAFSKAEIGTILAVPMLVRVIAAPLISMVADRMPERTQVLVWSGLLSMLTVIALYFAHGYWPVVLIFAIQGAVYAPYVPIAEALLVTGVRRWGYDYGSMRLWGSIAFVATNLIGGTIIGRLGGSAVIPAMMVGYVLCVLMAFVAPKVGSSANPDQPRRGSGPPTRKGLSRPDLQLAMIGSAIVQGSHALLFTFSAIYWTSLGFSGLAIGLLWSAGVIGEIVTFSLARYLNRWFSPWTLIRIGCAMAVMRWSLFPHLTSYWPFLALQCTHAFTFAFCHVGIQRRIVETVDETQEASAQGTYAFYNGATNAAVTFVSGFLFASFGLQSFYAMSLVCLIGLGCVVLASMVHAKHVTAARR